VLETKLETEKMKQIQNAEEDHWFRSIYFDLAPEERRSLKAAVFRNKFRLPAGTLQSLIQSTGVNFNTPPANSVLDPREPEIANQIR
jgi:hypothetical protein